MASKRAQSSTRAWDIIITRSKVAPYTNFIATIGAYEWFNFAGKRPHIYLAVIVNRILGT